MTNGLYSTGHIQSVLVQTGLPPSIRILRTEHASDPLKSVPSDTRFGSAQDGYFVLYSSPDFGTSFVEAIIRDRFVHEDCRAIEKRQITDSSWALIKTKDGHDLNLLDLRGDGCVRLGADTDVVNARDHGKGRALGSYIHAYHPNVDGFVFSSRLTKEDVYAVFDRVIGDLQVVNTGRLGQRRADVEAVLNRYEIKFSY